MLPSALLPVPLQLMPLVLLLLAAPVPTAPRQNFDILHRKLEPWDPKDLTLHPEHLKPESPTPPNPSKP